MNSQHPPLLGALLLVSAASFAGEMGMPQHQDAMRGTLDALFDPNPTVQMGVADAINREIEMSPAAAGPGSVSESKGVIHPQALQGTLANHFDPRPGTMDMVQSLNREIEMSPTAAGPGSAMGDKAGVHKDAYRGTLDWDFNPYHSSGDL